MNGLIIFIGESFRLGNQFTRNRGNIKSYNNQIDACNSHINFIDYIINKFNLTIDIYIATYNTQFNQDLLLIYAKYLIGKDLYDDVIGLNNLFKNIINKINNINRYDFILYIRIDLFLKQYFIEIFNPNLNTILFPTICSRPYHKYENKPRVNDMLLFIPKKYYKYLNNIIICHENWYNLLKNTDLTNDDIDTIIYTYHDSDSYKDFNPLYYIVNRDQSTIFHSEGYIFNKYNFN
jgi:hypothetical protein